MNIKLKKLQPSDVSSKLAEIPDAPDELYLEGTLPDENTHIYLAVIGPRKHTDYAKRVCEDLVQGLAGHPFVIVSGLALGIDTVAHTSALKAGLPTVAVPGSGLAPHVLYPKSNFALARTIIDAGGALLSEFPPEFEATPWSFPKRNRIVAGMCSAILVIEAGETSGALITAKLGLEYGRDILAVPGSIYTEQAKGSNSLIARGAYVVTSSEDIIKHFNLESNETPETPSFDMFTQQEIALLRLLSEPRTKSYLYEHSGLSPSESGIVLSTLELKGIIKEEYGKIYRAR